MKTCCMRGMTTFQFRIKNKNTIKRKHQLIEKVCWDGGCYEVDLNRDPEGKQQNL